MLSDGQFKMFLQSFERATGSPRKLAYMVKEAVDLLPWGKTKVYEMIAAGDIPTRVKWGHRYIMHDDLLAVLLTVAPEAPEAERPANAA